MAPSLEDLRNEVIDSIVVLSELGDICSLRLCSRTLATKATQIHFKSYFLSRHVDIIDTSRREFVHLTQPGWLGYLIQHLVLVGVVNNTRALEADLREGSGSEEADGDREWMTKAQQDLDILNEAFRNIVANSRIGRLLSMSLEVVVYCEDAEKRMRPPVRGDWGLIWKSTTHTFHTAIRSLALHGRSLACNELGRINFEHKGLAISLASLKSLSVSFSDAVIYRSTQDEGLFYDPTEEVDWEIDSEARDCNDSIADAEDGRKSMGLAKLLQLNSQLEDLELHQCALRERILTRCGRLFQRTAEIPTPPKLKRLEFRGFDVGEQDFLVFI